ncbi:EscU/YscU/HrcU family type III secretion system export apparatus switch protein [Pseudomonas coleopterorum]|uniref:EscU/YscU/HrcU family type III secretion system export apparatus switch protein n=1 Tax=Pseudomonas coleopterorum TaxID=1605838 RepID=UPI002A6AA69B|nr:EscU/YscU/HrcU family type III secretion system export apparatus switch protein [Pseudomonas coleopterorum]MDY1016428.1 EscU/YscU/HrcU family type III secretion system export apparatus switch protein [Pseudomonas coleopterorum]
MSDQPSEEKSLPASQKKLRDARRKGQLPKSQDMVTAMVILTCSLYLISVVDELQQRCMAFVDLVAQVWSQPFASLWPRVQSTAVDLLLSITLPLLAVTVVTVVLSNLVTMGGPVFSADPIKPEFERISPVAGFKRIFSVRSLIELLKGLFKLGALATAFVLVYRTGMQSLMQSSGCGAECVRASFLQMFRPLLATLIIAFLLVGALDVLMQRWLFGREMRMTKSDRKRETKDTDGDPLIRQARQRQRKQMHALATKRGLHNATLVIGEAGQWAVALRYVRGETPVPVIVSRASEDESAAMLEQAWVLGIAQAVNGPLARRIAVRAAGDAVPDATFQEVADILVGARLI